MTPELDTKLFEEVINEIFPGLTMYVRDVNLSPDIAGKYAPDMIIMEPGFTDASSRVMGMVTTHRFAILSNHMADFGPYEHDTNWGLFVARRNAHFKILDIYEYQGRTQILLLHLPDDNRWKLFENVKINLEDQIIEDSRKRFENKSVQDPVPELAKENWLARCASPLGMSDDGAFFDLDPNLLSELRQVKDTGFREFYHRFVYIECRDVLERLMGDFLNDDDTGAIAYGYIDEQAGLSFQIVKVAAIKDNHICFRDSIEKAMLIMRYGSLEKARFIDLAQTDVDTKQFADFEQMIRENYDTDNPEKEQLRELAFLDSCRHPDYPDDLAVLLLHEDHQPEQVWVRGDHLTENEIRGTLLNEPNADFGVHHGDSIQIIPYKQDDGSIVCVSPQSN